MLNLAESISCFPALASPCLNEAKAAFLERFLLSALCGVQGLSSHWEYSPSCGSVGISGESLWCLAGDTATHQSQHCQAKVVLLQGKGTGWRFLPENKCCCIECDEKATNTTDPSGSNPSHGCWISPTCARDTGLPRGNQVKQSGVPVWFPCHACVKAGVKLCVYVFLKHVFITGWGGGGSSWPGKGRSDVPSSVCLHWRLVLHWTRNSVQAGADTCPFQYGTGALEDAQPSAVLSSPQVQNILWERWNVPGLRKDNLRKVIISVNCFVCVLWVTPGTLWRTTGGQDPKDSLSEHRPLPDCFPNKCLIKVIVQ